MTGGKEYGSESLVLKKRKGRANEQALAPRYDQCSHAMLDHGVRLDGWNDGTFIPTAPLDPASSHATAFHYIQKGQLAQSSLPSSGQQ